MKFEGQICSQLFFFTIIVLSRDDIEIWGPMQLEEGG